MAWDSLALHTPMTQPGTAWPGGTGCVQDEGVWVNEHSLAWQQQPLAQHARLVATATPACALGLAVRVAVDEVLEAQAPLPTFEVCLQQQEA